MAYSKSRCKAKLNDGRRCSNPAKDGPACRVIAHKEQLSRVARGTAQRARTRAKPKAKGKGKAPSTRLAKVLAQQTAFLEAYLEHGVIGSAAEAIGISRSRHYEWLEDLERFPDYGARFADTHENAVDRLELEALRRGREGVEEPVFGKKYDELGRPCGSEVVGHIRRYSDRMLELMLKARRPGVFRERVSAELTGAGGQPLAAGLDLSKLSTETLEKIRDELAAAED